MSFKQRVDDIHYLCRPYKNSNKITEEMKGRGEFKLWRKHQITEAVKISLPPANKSEHKLGKHADDCF